MYYTNLEKYDMIECYIKNNDNADAACATYSEIYPERRKPNRKMFARLKENLIDHGSFTRTRSKNYSKPNNEENEVDIISVVEAEPSISSRQIESESGHSKSRVLRTLKKYKYRPYKIRKMQLLHAQDYQRRLTFCNWYLQKIRENNLFFNDIIWTDECYISSAGMFNRWNEHQWSDENRHPTVNIANQGRFGFGVWCAIYQNRVLAVHIYDNKLTSQRYLDIINEHIIEGFMDNLPLNEAQKIHLQQDGAPQHNGRIVVNTLNNYFRDKWIGTNGPIRWPPRSPDITPLDFFFWGHIKNKLYKMENLNIIQLKENFLECVNAISNIHIHNAINSIYRRCDQCIRRDGRQFENYL